MKMLAAWILVAMSGGTAVEEDPADSWEQDILVVRLNPGQVRKCHDEGGCAVITRDGLAERIGKARSAGMNEDFPVTDEGCIVGRQRL